MRLRFAGVIAVATLLSAAGCGTPTFLARSPDLPPSPTSITKEHPGGDAADPERAALERLMKESRGQRSDRYGTMRVPLFDWRHWQRVRLWVSPSRAAFQFGDDHYGFDAIWYTKAEGASDPESCLSAFEAMAQPIADSYGLRTSEAKVVRTHQNVRGERRAMLIKVLEGSLESLFASNDYVGAVVAYESWPGTCLVQGFAVVATNHRELAIRVRDRWVNEAAPALFWDKALHQAPDLDAR